LAVSVGDGLGDDADIGNAGLAKRVDDGAEGAERDGFVGAKKNGVVGVLGLLFDFFGELVNVSGVVTKVDALIFVDGNDQSLLGDFLDGMGFRDVDFDAGLQDGSGDHENDEEDEDDVDEWDHVDVRKGALRGFG